jgi:hypothetical protein
MNLEFRMNAATSAVVMDFAKAALVNNFALLAGKCLSIGNDREQDSTSTL